MAGTNKAKGHPDEQGARHKENTRSAATHRQAMFTKDHASRSLHGVYLLHTFFTVNTFGFGALWRSLTQIVRSLLHQHPDPSSLQTNPSPANTQRLCLHTLTLSPPPGSLVKPWVSVSSAESSTYTHMRTLQATPRRSPAANHTKRTGAGVNRKPIQA